MVMGAARDDAEFQDILTSGLMQNRVIRSAEQRIVPFSPTAKASEEL